MPIQLALWRVQRGSGFRGHRDPVHRFREEIGEHGTAVRVVIDTLQRGELSWIHVKGGDTAGAFALDDGEEDEASAGEHTAASLLAKEGLQQDGFIPDLAPEGVDGRPASTPPLPLCMDL